MRGYTNFNFAQDL